MDRKKAKVIAKAFGGVLKQARTDAGLSQQKLAEAIGVDPVFISFIENGHRQPSITVLLLAERALDLAAGTLSARTEERLGTVRG